MLNWFKKNKRASGPPIFADMHSHLLPGLDDGVKAMDQAEQCILTFIEAGYKKIITTPHIMADYYKNTNESILEGVSLLREHLHKKGIEIIIDAAAEYYMDEYVTHLLETDYPLLTFGDKYLLFETNFFAEPLTLKEFIFLATTKGYKPVLAHPERYLYLHGDMSKIEDLLNRGVLLQININSITGHYSKPVQRFAFNLIDKGYVHFLGSDCHHPEHASMIREAQRHKYFQKALTLPLLNNSL